MNARVDQRRVVVPQLRATQPRQNPAEGSAWVAFKTHVTTQNVQQQWTQRGVALLARI